MSERMVKELNLTPIARMVSCSVAGVEPIHMGIGPCAAIPKALKQGGLKLADIEQIERADPKYDPYREEDREDALRVTRDLHPRSPATQRIWLSGRRGPPLAADRSAIVRR